MSAGSARVLALPATGLRLASVLSFSATMAGNGLRVSTSPASTSGPLRNANRSGLSLKASTRSANGRPTSTLSPLIQVLFMAAKLPASPPALRKWRGASLNWHSLPLGPKYCGRLYDKDGIGFTELAEHRLNAKRKGLKFPEGPNHLPYPLSVPHLPPKHSNRIGSLELQQGKFCRTCTSLMQTVSVNRACRLQSDGKS